MQACKEMALAMKCSGAVVFIAEQCEYFVRTLYTERLMGDPATVLLDHSCWFATRLGDLHK